MFNLEHEVDKWSEEFAGSKCGRNDRVEELKDHLFCEIENNVKEGLNEESAFLAATRRFGISDDLKAEFRKGKGIAALLCEPEADSQWFDLSPKDMAIYTGIYLVLFAGLTFGLAYMLRGTDTFSYVTPFLWIVMFLPIAFSSAFRKKSHCEWTYIKRKLGFGK